MGETPNSSQTEKRKEFENLELSSSLDLPRLIFCPEAWTNQDITVLTPLIPSGDALVN